jgi:putative nucleotidyltransferase with HDIG domain
VRERAKVVLRKLRREAAQPKWRRSKTVRWSIGIILTLAVAALFPRPGTQTISGYSVGSLWTNEDVVAPFSFPINKDINRYRQEVRAAEENLYPVYVPDTTAPRETITAFQTNWQQVIDCVTRAGTDTLREVALRDSLPKIGLSKDEWHALALYDQSGPRTVKSSKRALTSPETNSPLAAIEPIVSLAINNLEHAEIIAKNTPASDSFSSSAFISYRSHANEETILARTSLIPIEEAQNRIYSQLEQKFKQSPDLVRAIGKVVAVSLQPNAIFSTERTQENHDALVNRVMRTEGIIKEGQRIVERGEVVTPQSKSALESLSQARLDRGGVAAQAARVIGTVGHAAIILLLLVLYLRFIRRKIYNDNAQLLLLGLVLLFPAVLAYLSLHIRLAFPFEYLILIPVASMLLTILFDSRTGFYGTVICALMVAGIRGNDYTVALAGLSAGAFAAYTVRDLRSRAQLFQSIGYIFLGYLIAIIALSLEKSSPFSEMGYDLLAASINALLSPVLTFGMLYVVESIFDTMSDLRLTEYDNINHPLLRELAMRAPGTYQHTMLVAQLSENAAIAIGANALLAKVGAFFHDIGKLAEPTDFIENQPAELGNIHDSISPLESAERIRNHVIEGIALARAHHLPEKIIEFIPMHHGTLRISFFYDRALAASVSGIVPNEEIFRYPGPKPASKETAIVMLADASEAVARTLATVHSEPTIETIEESLEKLIRARFADGQLDDCDLTIRDLTIIRKVFARLLAGLHHTRILYPTPSVTVPIPVSARLTETPREQAAT